MLLRLLRIISFVCFILFTGLLSTSYIQQDNLEASAIHFVKQQIETEIKATYQSHTTSTFKDKAQLLSHQLNQTQQKLEIDLDNLPEKISKIVSSMCGYNHVLKRPISEEMTQSLKQKIYRLKSAQDRLKDIVEGKYIEIFGKLLLDIRIFCASNASIFFLIFFISLVTSKNTKFLILPSILLFISTTLASAIYLFGQNWFYTIVYNSYMGFGYLGYIGFIFMQIMDINLLKK